VDDAPEMIEGIRNGTVSFTYVQQPYGQGYLTIYIPYRMYHDGVAPNIKYLDTRITLVDQSNVDSYQDTMKENFEEIKEMIDAEILE
jgi:ABC-type sugar transport system substrate-binding protein